MDKALAALIKISTTTGKDTALVQGGGGNTSVKTADGKYMFIKASGTALKDMNESRGWRRMNLAKVLAIIQDSAVAKLHDQKREVEVVNRLLAACQDNVTATARPSVEAHLHALLDRCVIHLHPIAIGAYVNAKGGKTQLDRLFKGERLPYLWVPYTDPGFMLARKIAKLVAEYKATYRKKPQVLILEKHGIFITSDSEAVALRLVKKVVGKCQSKLTALRTKKLKAPAAESVMDAKLAIRSALYKATGTYQTISHFYGEKIAAFMAIPKAKEMLGAGTLNPDELVYANGSPLWLDELDAGKLAAKLSAAIAKGNKPATVFLVKGMGLFIAGKESLTPVLRDIAESSFFIRANAARMGGILTLTKREGDFINKWESEAFRKALSTGSGSGGAIKDRIAIVTGAGSGLGRSIAIGLARDGAMVGLADLDLAAAEVTLAMIKMEMPLASVMVVPCNVTKEDNVKAGLEAVVARWGGLDILVNAAGVAPAYPLVDLPVEKWRFALEVNLTGYFLMAKWAAKIMIKQQMGGSIVNLSSKTGLDASMNNTPYNATKAGELHMARGWAMELGKHGIRVNSVCPGNVFEGSKIWNPAYIKECAKKYGIKPEEVIPYYVSRTILKREIKGQDIADSIVFLCSDKAKMITGQTIVADAGQVFVR
jgi:NAD(P)-dependent dehydrogenase (short-subunit alcohol dehydrogenase family)/rhamnose utilization protein RhaD (predicted bifunctional aldolase and dehydrogenase)